jgi:hypothetical protein
MADVLRDQEIAWDTDEAKVGDHSTHITSFRNAALPESNVGILRVVGSSMSGGVLPHAA